MVNSPPRKITKHRDASLIILQDSNEKILLQFRGHHAKVNKNMWGFFGGGIEEGETAKDAVIREIFEELNYRSSNPTLKLVKTVKWTDLSSTVHIFIETFDDSQDIRLQEGTRMAWFSVAEALNLVTKKEMAESDREILLELFRQ
ncbi:MAG: NUDIX domain-containing protein [Candidatus Woesearchaeota archaeon]